MGQAGSMLLPCCGGAALPHLELPQIINISTLVAQGGEGHADTFSIKNAATAKTAGALQQPGVSIVIGGRLVAAQRLACLAPALIDVRCLLVIKFENGRHVTLDNDSAIRAVIQEIKSRLIELCSGNAAGPFTSAVGANLHGLAAVRQKSSDTSSAYKPSFVPQWIVFQVQPVDTPQCTQLPSMSALQACTQHLRSMLQSDPAVMEELLKAVCRWQPCAAAPSTPSCSHEQAPINHAGPLVHETPGKLGISTAYLREQDGVLHPGIIFEIPGSLQRVEGEGIPRERQSAGSSAPHSLQFSSSGHTVPSTSGASQHTDLSSAGSSWPLVTWSISTGGQPRHSPKAVLAHVQDTSSQRLASPENTAMLVKMLSIMSNVPYLVTLVDMELGPTFQNTLSEGYYGVLVHEQGASMPLTAAALLERLLPTQSWLVQDLLQALDSGMPWKRVLQVPRHCSNQSVLTKDDHPGSASSDSWLGRALRELQSQGDIPGAPITEGTSLPLPKMPGDNFDMADRQSFNTMLPLSFDRLEPVQEHQQEGLINTTSGVGSEDAERQGLEGGSSSPASQGVGVGSPGASSPQGAGLHGPAQDEEPLSGRTSWLEADQESGSTVRTSPPAVSRELRNHDASLDGKQSLLRSLFVPGGSHSCNLEAADHVTKSPTYSASLPSERSWNASGNPVNPSPKLQSLMAVQALAQTPKSRSSRGRSSRQAAGSLEESSLSARSFPHSARRTGFGLSMDSSSSLINMGFTRYSQPDVGSRPLGSSPPGSWQGGTQWSGSHSDTGKPSGLPRNDAQGHKTLTTSHSNVDKTLGTRSSSWHPRTALSVSGHSGQIARNSDAADGNSLTRIGARASSPTVRLEVSDSSPGSSLDGSRLLDGNVSALLSDQGAVHGGMAASSSSNLAGPVEASQDRAAAAGSTGSLEQQSEALTSQQQREGVVQPWRQQEQEMALQLQQQEGAVQPRRQQEQKVALQLQQQEQQEGTALAQQPQAPGDVSLHPSPAPVAVGTAADSVSSGTNQQEQQHGQGQHGAIESSSSGVALPSSEHTSRTGAAGRISSTSGASESSMHAELQDMLWHDVEALPVQDPITGKKMMLLLQTDITTRTVMEMRMASLTERQLSMLEQMFPRHVLEYMVAGAVPPARLGGLATSHQDVTIMFMDIVGFTTMSKEVSPAQVMEFLNSLFTLFDDLIDQHDVYKVETAGDCYIVAGSLMEQDDEGFVALRRTADPQHGAEKVMAFAKAVLRCAKTICMPHNGEPTTVRVGIHTGPVVTGLIGTKLPKFSIFGDTMNTASRMESTCRPNCIQVTETTHQLLSRHTFWPTGGVEVKGKGLMETYLWVPEDHPEEQYISADEQAKEAAALISHINKQLPQLPATSSSEAASTSLNWLPSIVDAAATDDTSAGLAALSRVHSSGQESWSVPLTRMEPGNGMQKRRMSASAVNLANVFAFKRSEWRPPNQLTRRFARAVSSSMVDVLSQDRPGATDKPRAAGGAPAQRLTVHSSSGSGSSAQPARLRRLSYGSVTPEAAETAIAAAGTTPREILPFLRQVAALLSSNPCSRPSELISSLHQHSNVTHALRQLHSKRLDSQQQSIAGSRTLAFHRLAAEGQLWNSQSPDIARSGPAWSPGANRPNSNTGSVGGQSHSGSLDYYGNQVLSNSSNGSSGASDHINMPAGLAQPGQRRSTGSDRSRVAVVSAPSVVQTSNAPVTEELAIEEATASHIQDLLPTLSAWQGAEAQFSAVDSFSMSSLTSGSWTVPGVPQLAGTGNGASSRLGLGSVPPAGDASPASGLPTEAAASQVRQLGSLLAGAHALAPSGGSNALGATTSFQFRRQQSGLLGASGGSEVLEEAGTGPQDLSEAQYAEPAHRGIAGIAST